MHLSQYQRQLGPFQYRICKNRIRFYWNEQAVGRKVNMALTDEGQYFLLCFDEHSAQ
jgi:hypothetical protein